MEGGEYDYELISLELEGGSGDDEPFVDPSSSMPNIKPPGEGRMPAIIPPKDNSISDDYNSVPGLPLNQAKNLPKDLPKDVPSISKGLQ